MYSIGKHIGWGGELFGYFSWGCVYGTIEVLFGYTQVWEEGTDAYYNPFPTTAFIIPKITMIRTGSYCKVALVYPTDSSDFLQFCHWKNMFCLQSSSLKWKQWHWTENSEKYKIFYAHIDNLESDLCSATRIFQYNIPKIITKVEITKKTKVDNWDSNRKKSTNMKLLNKKFFINKKSFSNKIIRTWGSSVMLHLGRQGEQ